ncbi:hypothetical protein KCU65_g158, partial [Aureobasidium melanogenum]
MAPLPLNPPLPLSLIRILLICIRTSQRVPALAMVAVSAISRPIVDQGEIGVPNDGPYIYNHPSRPRLDVEIPRSSFSDLWGQRYGPIGDEGYNVDHVQRDGRNTQSMDFGRLVGGRENHRHDTRRYGVSLGGIADWNAFVAANRASGSQMSPEDEDANAGAEDDDGMDVSYLALLVSPTPASSSTSEVTASASLPSISNLPPLPPSTVALNDERILTPEPEPEEQHTRAPTPLSREPSERWVHLPTLLLLSSLPLTITLTDPPPTSSKPTKPPSPSTTTTSLLTNPTPIYSIASASVAKPPTLPSFLRSISSMLQTTKVSATIVLKLEVKALYQPFAARTQTRVPVAHTTIPEEDEEEEPDNDQENQPPTIIETLIESPNGNDHTTEIEQDQEEEQAEGGASRRHSVRHSWVTVSRCNTGTLFVLYQKNVSLLRMYPLILFRLEHIHLCSSRVLFVTEECIWLVLLNFAMLTCWVVVDSVAVVGLVFDDLLGLFCSLQGYRRVRVINAAGEQSDEVSNWSALSVDGRSLICVSPFRPIVSTRASLVSIRASLVKWWNVCNLILVLCTRSCVPGSDSSVRTVVGLAFLRQDLRKTDFGPLVLFMVGVHIFRTFMFHAIKRISLLS